MLPGINYPGMKYCIWSHIVAAESIPNILKCKEKTLQEVEKETIAH